MGSIQKYKDNRWRVQIRHRGFPSVSTIFDTYEEAKEFHDLIESDIEYIIKQRKLEKIMSKIKESYAK